ASSPPGAGAGSAASPNAPDRAHGSAREGGAAHHDGPAHQDGSPGEAGAPPKVVTDGQDGPSPQTRIPLRGARRLTAERLSRSHAEIPAAAAWTAADASRLLELRELVAARSPGLHVTPLAVLLRLCISALAGFPLLNSSYDHEHGEVVIPPAVHLGVATQTHHGLLVPVLRDAQHRSISDIAAELARITSAAREGTIDASLLSGSTFTVSNYGAFGIDGGVALVNPPEAAILGVGAIRARPWVAGDDVVVRPVVELSLAFDHRVCDGGDAGGFLRRLADLVEHPELTIAD
ncbi:MAG: 2-oxo acid dehydrogenase subunit E2, partial [Candidatus Dormiibacterota bacterium]